MRSLLPQFILMLLLCSTCQKHEEEIVPVPPASEATTGHTPPQVADDGIAPPLKRDSGYFQARTFRDMPYRILLPMDFDPARPYPMLTFLHGIGERGTDNEKQLSIGGSFFLRDSIREKHPAIVVYPQCPPDAYWFDSKIAAAVKELIDTLRKEFVISDNGTTIGGFSMGAYGTFEIVSRYPGFFEAALAISGDGDESKASGMADSRWRIFAGGRDVVVPSARSKKMADALAKAGASVQFTLYPGVDHGDTWAHAFAEPDLLDWLFPSHKPIITKMPVIRK